ncbi:MAG: AAA family ATPase, partial [Cycloclasticus sp.]|nr:AAA family ATPase [Cycloclasticus sp.]MBQ0790113.1 AAA family ATPase [Cycloclasticus sp.]
MRLEKIKLSGFKSFVDSTSIPFTSDLVAVVGPNGCGKSNVIDAVRWVLGESSAKHLRGDQMADVIFNGSTTRKPVGQAFVELVFDNSDATIAGEFAAYQQISLKRQVNREGQSVYFLNGTRCRRKDITDLFLGTGLGARSYAIIEQGTISRLIEAKPDELRVFLEEAAGISKYKERRRDTENRMRRTRENLERLADLCEEIEKQCRHLKRQAATAGKYKELKTQERQLKAQLLALRWRALDEQDERQHKNSKTLQNKVDELLARQREIEKEIEQQRETHTAQRDTLNEVQASFYAVGSDIAKAEQALQHQQAQKQQRHAELERYQGILGESKQALLDSEQKQSQLTEQIDTIEQGLIKAKAKEGQSAKALTNAEQEMTRWQKTWDDFTYQVAEPKRKTDVEKTKINQLERQLMQSTQRLSNLKADQTRLQQVLLQSDCEALQQQHNLAENQLQQTQHKLVASQQQITESQTFIHQESDALAEQRSERARLSGRLESILVLQQANLGESQQQVGRWLDG